MDFPSNYPYFSLLNLSFVENCHISIFTTFAKQSMINRLSNSINCNRSAAKISKVMSSTPYPSFQCFFCTRNSAAFGGVFPCVHLTQTRWKSWSYTCTHVPDNSLLAVQLCNVVHPVLMQFFLFKDPEKCSENFYQLPNIQMRFQPISNSKKSIHSHSVKSCKILN